MAFLGAFHFSCTPFCVFAKKRTHNVLARIATGHQHYWYQGGRCYFATVEDFGCAMSGCGPTCRGRGCTVTPRNGELGDLPRIRTQLPPECYLTSAYSPHSGGNLKRHSSRDDFRDNKGTTAE